MDSGENLLRDAMRVAIPVEEPEKVAARREALLKVIERQVALSPGRVQRFESRRKWIQGSRWGMAAAALVLAVGMGMLVQSQQRESGAVRSHRAADAMPAHGSTQGARIAHQGEALSTSSGEKQRLRLPGDTVVSVGERTGLRLIEAMPKRQVMELDHGRVDVDVTPAAGAEARYVSVRTPHAIVEVKGTIFSVDVHSTVSDSTVPDSTAAPTTNADEIEAGKSRLATTVSVQRGAVLVHSASGDLTLRAGDSWTSAEVLLPASDVSKPKLATHTVKAPPHASEKKPSSEVVSPEPALQAPAGQRSSTLAEENELLERVIVAAESGQQERALKLCDDFLGRYPRSPLRATVMAKRNQLQSR